MVATDGPRARQECRAYQRVCGARGAAAARGPGAGGRLPVLLAALALALAALSGCQQGRTRLTVRGGPSLESLFADLGAAYQQQHPEVTVITDFTCPPCVLFKRPGAAITFDLFASLGQFELDRLTQVGKLSFASPTAFGTTRLALVTSTRAPAAVKSLQDLKAGAVRRIGIGDPEQVGVGYYARQALLKAGLWEALSPRLVQSQSGCELLKWLGLGRDIDAAIVFGVCSDSERSSIREIIELPAQLAPPVPLLLARPEQGANAATAQGFVDFVRSPAAQPILARHKVGPVS